MRILGIDYGKSKVGLAVGDDVSRIASPLEVRSAGSSLEETADELAAFAVQEDFDVIAVGIPYRSDGSHSGQTDENLAFAAALRTSVSIPVIEVGEAFTSKESQRLQREYGSNVAEDALAAMLIVQEYFDTLE